MAVKLIDELQKEIKAAGEAVTQEAYEKAYDHVFQILDNLEKLLNDNRYLEGNEITEEDKRLYDILIRFDAVYYFKQRLNRKALRDYDKEYRGQHYGAAVITAAEDWFAERGVKKIFINSRTEAVGFYEKLGYVADPKQITGTGAFQCIMTEKQL